jgi:hypothetical protein
MRPLFSLQWMSSGPTMGRREAGRRWLLARFAPLREEEEDGRLGRLRGRGPVERGGAASWKKRSGSRLGRLGRK